MKCVIKPVFHLEMELSQDEINEMYQVFAFDEGLTKTAVLSNFTSDIINKLEGYVTKEDE